jgi:hypothetical protein
MKRAEGQPRCQGSQFLLEWGFEADEVVTVAHANPGEVTLRATYSSPMARLIACTGCRCP